MTETFPSLPPAAKPGAQFASRCLARLYPVVRSERLRARFRQWIMDWEGGGAFSPTIRHLLRQFHGVEVEPYSAGPCSIRPKNLHRGTRFGRYVSVAPSLRTFTRHHPRDTRSTHGVFYNPGLGKVNWAPLRHGTLEIGHGAWIGENVIILHPAERIGIGAVIAPGSVVYTNVPPYAKVSGNPAMVTGYRFNKETIAALLESRWWELPFAEVVGRGIVGRQAREGTAEGGESRVGTTDGLP